MKHFYMQVHLDQNDPLKSANDKNQYKIVNIKFCIRIFQLILTLYVCIVNIRTLELTMFFLSQFTCDGDFDRSGELAKG